jgi:hypothetical protein
MAIKPAEYAYVAAAVITTIRHFHAPPYVERRFACLAANVTQAAQYRQMSQPLDTLSYEMLMKMRMSPHESHSSFSSSPVIFSATPRARCRFAISRRWFH